MWRYRSFTGITTYFLLNKSTFEVHLFTFSCPFILPSRNLRMEWRWYPAWFSAVRQVKKKVLNKCVLLCVTRDKWSRMYLSSAIGCHRRGIPKIKVDDRVIEPVSLCQTAHVLEIDGNFVLRRTRRILKRSVVSLFSLTSIKHVFGDRGLTPCS